MNIPPPRLATAEDAPRVTSLTNRAFEIYVSRLGFEPKPMITDHLGWIDEGYVWVLTDDHSLIGAIVMFPEGDEFLIYGVAVDPDRQRQGHGRILMKAADDQARLLRLTGTLLYTNEKMTENIRFYESLGYEHCGRQQHENHPNSWIIFMRKAL
jgi:ribosomal protein S18 acetylase RimI-like enzyme